MPCDISWYIDRRVILQRLYGVVTIEEYVQLQKDGMVYVMQGKPPVHALIATAEITRVPSLIELSRLSYTPAPGLGWLVTAVHQPIYRFAATVLSQFVGKNFKIVASVEEGYAFLCRMDPTLPALPSVAEQSTTDAVDDRL
jgi:hypothetical protein